jgi:hypothetical protein
MTQEISLTSLLPGYISIRKERLKADFRQGKINASFWTGAIDELDRLRELVEKAKS